MTDPFKSLRRIPDKLYPFSEITEEGKVLYGQEAYNHRLRSCAAKYKYSYAWQCFRLWSWRFIVHFISSILLVIIVHTIGLFTSIYVAMIIFAVLLLWWLYQELIYDPKQYGQHLHKGLLDILAWTLPVLIYLIMFL